MYPRVVSYPINPALWEVRMPCPYSDGEVVVFIGTLFECLFWKAP